MSKRNKHHAFGRHIDDHPARATMYARPGENWWTLTFDGNARNNGKSHATGNWSFHVQDDYGESVATGSGPCEAFLVTNNTSEFNGLLSGLEEIERSKFIQEANVVGLFIRGDSNLVINQMTGSWKAKNEALQEYRDDCLDVLHRLAIPWAARWIPREENTFCDELGRTAQ